MTDLGMNIKMLAVWLRYYGIAGGILLLLSVAAFCAEMLVLIPELYDGCLAPGKRLWLWISVVGVAVSRRIFTMMLWEFPWNILVIALALTVLTAPVLRKNMGVLWLMFLWEICTLSWIKQVLIMGIELPDIITYDEELYIEILWEIVVILLFLWIACRMKRKEISFYSICRGYWGILILIDVTEYVLICYGFRGDPVFNGFLLNVGALILTVAGILLMSLWAVNRQILSEKREMEMKQAYYLEMQERYREVSKLNHDIRRERDFLYQRLTNGQVEEAVRYLREKEQLRTNGGRIITHLGFVDAVLNHKIDEMEEQKIPFKLTGEITKCPVREDDFGVMLGNLLDNAVEAAGQCSEGKRWVYLDLSEQNEMCRVSIKNSSLRSPSRENGRFITSKENTLMHGWGLQNVETIVRKYQGTIKYEYGDRDFQVLIVFWKTYSGE